MNRTALLLTSLGGILVALTLCGLSMHLPRIDTTRSAVQTNIVVVLLVAEGLVYFAAIYLALRFQPSRYSVFIVVAVAIIIRLLVLFDYPVLSSDVYRYVWDGQVQRAGINPYRYIPSDPALNYLRDPAVFPFINRSSYAPTIYPPAAQLIFGFVGRITSTVTGMKVAMVAFEALASLCMLRLLSVANVPRERLLIYAWNPLAQWSFAYDGHVDAAAIGLLAVALLFHTRRRFGLAGGFLAGSVLVKFIPIVVAPAFIRDAPFWKPALTGTLLIAALYGFYASAGMRILGFLPAYGSEEGFDNGSGVWLLVGLSRLFTLPRITTTIYFIGAITGYALLSIWIARRPLPRDVNPATTLCRDTAILASCAMIIVSPHYPWYFAWLALPAVLAPLPSVIWLSTTPVILYLDPWHERFLWPCLVYLPAIGMAAATIWRQWSRYNTASIPSKRTVRCPL